MSAPTVPDSAIIECMEEGLTLFEAEERLGLGHNQISRRARAMGRSWPRGRKRKTAGLMPNVTPDPEVIHIDEALASRVIRAPVMGAV